jgi:DNA primase
MIPDDLVERIRESADIVQIIGEHVSLKRMGSDFRGPCPFHQGTHRNFSVSARKRMYYCFVCHEGGDVFSFLQKRLGIEWPQAVRMVGEKLGIDVPDATVRREGPDPREKVWEVNATAADYFRRMLWEDDAGRAARGYLEQRRVTREIAERFGLGWAPREIGLLRSYMGTLGFDDARLSEAGLLATDDEQAEPRPRFRGRLIFPIHDPSGHAVGFGGRLIGAGEPKYLNSPDSPTFSKGRLLYNLHGAKQSIRREDRVLVVEGYFDVVRLVAAGIESVVAPLGTALTEAQGVLLRRYTRNAFLLYDSDPPGLKATFRAADILLAQGMAVQVVTLPEGEDPDTFVGAHGREKLDELLDGALDVFERKVQILERKGYLATLRQRRRATDLLLDTIRVTADPVTRDLYIARASEALGVSRELLIREAGAAARGAPAPEQAPDRVVAAGPGAPNGARTAASRPAGAERRRPGASRGTSAERDLLAVMLNAREQIESIAERVSPDEFRNGSYRRIFAALLAKGADATVEELAGAIEGDDIPVLEALLARHDVLTDVDRAIEGSLAKLRQRPLYARMAEIDRDLPLANDAEKNELIAEKARLRQQLDGIGGVGKRFGKSRR